MASLIQVRKIKTDWLLYGGSAVFFACLITYALTNLYLALAVPFALGVVMLAILNLRTFYWFFLLCIPFSATIYFLGDSLSTTVPDEPLAWLLLGITGMLLVYDYRQFPQWFFKNSITLVITLQVLWMLFTLIFSQEFLPSLKYVLAKLWFLNAYFIFPVFVFRHQRDFKKAFLILAIPITLHAFVAFGWHYTYHFNYWLSNKVVRPFYFNHVDYSTILSMTFPMFLIAWWLSKGRKILRWLLALIIIFYLPAIVAASARAAILAVFFSLMIAGLIKLKKVNWVMPTAYALLLAGVLFLAHNNYYIKFQPDKKYTATKHTFSEAITGMFTGTDMSSMERFYRWIASVRMSREHPIVGVGPNNFYEHYKPHTVTMFSTWVSRNPERSTVHNYFLYLLVEQGWPAMILYGILIYLVFAKAQKLFHRAETRTDRSLILGMTMIFAAGFVNNFFSELIDTHKVGALFYLSAAGLVIMEQFLDQNRPNSLTSADKDPEKIA